MKYIVRIFGKFGSFAIDENVESNKEGECRDGFAGIDGGGAVRED